MKVVSSLVLALFVLTSISFVYQVLNPPKAHTQFMGCEQGGVVADGCTQGGPCPQSLDDWNAYFGCVNTYCGDLACACAAIMACGGECNPNPC
jgi:hypothetical protein